MLKEYKQSKRLVVKIGSALLIEGNAINAARLAALAGEVAAAQSAGKQIILVSSGAVALGCAKLKLERRAISLEQAQAAAAVGQIDLMAGWERALAAHKITAAQILLTSSDTEQRRGYLNARGTLASLLKGGCVPIINENDSIATQELRYGDNDRLAARVAVMVGADALVLLSDVDGLYEQSPKLNSAARHIARVEEINDEIIAMGGASDSSYGSGGMATKIAAAQMATAGGAHVILTSGRTPAPLSCLLDGADKSTLFLAKGNPRSARQNWIGGTLEPCGSLTIDAGAERALKDGNSLLPVGITAIDGAFMRGDCVRVLNNAGDELARGLIAYTHIEAAQIIGHGSEEIASILGYQGRAAMIHRDNLVMG